MNMVRVLIQLPRPLKAKLDAERKRGTSAAGLIRHLLEQHFKGKRRHKHHDQGGLHGDRTMLLACLLGGWRGLGLSRVLA